MDVIQNHVNGLKIGDVQSYKSLALAPILGCNGTLDHIVLADALQQGFEIGEKKGGASVPFLHAANKSGKYVLAIAGEYVVGGLQNRTLIRNIYFDKNFGGDIPVRCIEQRRWHAPMPEQVPEQEEEPQPLPPGHPDIPQPGQPRREPKKKREPVFCMGGHTPVSALFAHSQGEAWDGIRCLIGETGTHSSSGNLGDIYSQRQRDFEEYIKNFPLIDRQVGILAAISRNGKKIFTLDLFDRNEIFEKHYRNLISSYALETGLKENGKTELTEKEVQGFLSCMEQYAFTQQQAISAGQDCKISGENFDGSVLLFNGNFVYLNLHSRREESSKSKTEQSVFDQFRRETGFRRDFY